VLRIAGIEDLFQERVDGVTSVELKLKGKPHPEIFLKCAEWMKVGANRSVVVEDAISGVKAGRDGRFGLVIGIDRMDISEKLRENGADVVIPDFLNVNPNDINEWYLKKNKISSMKKRELK
jgi:beta-phosphoglucomutase-like phosphatase (HAD superfamily)